MTNTSARLLEFDSLRDLLSGYAASDLGRTRLERLAPSTEVSWIQSQQRLTSEVREFRRAGGSFNFSGLIDISKILEKARISGVALDPEEIVKVITLVDRAAEWREIAFNPPQGMKADWAAVRELSSGIAGFAALLKSIRNKILPDGTLDDRASPQLASIRREVEKQRRGIQDSLRGYLRRLSEGGSTQDDLVTVRGERFVIPVKIEQKRRVQGVVHGASSSGQTVFIEPLETIEQNNELVRLLEEEQAEIRRILLEMTQRIGEQSSDIYAAQQILAELELQFAKARFADDYNCVAPTLRMVEGQAPSPVQEEQSSAGGHASSLIVRDARHPLLERNLRTRAMSDKNLRPTQNVVPISVELEDERRELIITGPNTGGKTVTLKTIGLLTLMAQSGIPVPASRMEMPVFDVVLADIGDYQSIEQNLSTFSAHVTNIDFISRTATPQSLVLLDELGSATDPEEGAALAVAIADHFLKIGCITAISTHHTSLKVFGANSSGVLNAAVGFDEATLKPTYELKTGVPGASAGINIAQRLGLNPEIVQSARGRLGTQARDVGKFLDQLHEQLKAAEAERFQLRSKEADLDRERTRLAAEGKREQQDKVRELEKKLESLMRDFEYHAREAVTAVQDRAAAQKVSKEAERRIAKLRRDFREQFDSAVVAHVSGADRGDPNAAPQLVKHVSEGDVVKLKSVGRNAKIVRKIDDKHFEVEVGAMKMRVAREDVAEVVVRASDTPVNAARAKGVSISLHSEDANVPSEINVIGHTVDDATREVEKFVDRAFLAGLPRIRVVHGSGMGILRKALRQFLQKHPHVESIAEPPQNEGGGGATVAELKI
ncbi:MAG TPA: endonuclease MutS2 [Terriglobales bacterium]|nr:endonuclease MutS2 [Terriglobales bacterium]